MLAEHFFGVRPSFLPSVDYFSRKLIRANRHLYPRTVLRGYSSHDRVSVHKIQIQLSILTEENMSENIHFSIHFFFFLISNTF